MIQVAAAFERWATFIYRRRRVTTTVVFARRSKPLIILFIR